MTASLIIPVSCPNCGGGVEQVASSVIQSDPSTEARSVLRCGACNRQSLLTVLLRPAADTSRGRRPEMRMGG